MAWFIFLVFLLKITSWACMLGSGLKLILHWYAQLSIFTKSSINSFLVVLLLSTTENNVSLANNSAFDERPFGRSLIWIRKSNGPRTEPETPALTMSHEIAHSVLPFILFTKKSCKSLCYFPDMSFCCNLNTIPSCQTFQISRKTPLTF